MRRFRFKCAMPVLGLALAACSQPAEVIKSAQSDVDGFTYGQLLDNKKNCKSTAWSSSKDDHDRPVTTYTCQIDFTSVERDGIEKPLTSMINDAYHRRQGERSGDLFGEANQRLQHELQGEQSSQTPRPERLQAYQAAIDKNTDLQKQIDAIYADCTANLAQSQAGDLKKVDDLYGGIHQITETVRFVVNDGKIVERNVSLSHDGVQIPMDNTIAAVFMLRVEDPNNRAAEQNFIDEILQKQSPVSEGTLGNCGQDEKIHALYEQHVEAAVLDYQLGG